MKHLVIFFLSILLFNSCKKTNNSSTSIPTLTTIAATNITFSSATCGGNITNDGNASVTARGVCWSISPSPTIANNKTTDGSGSGSFTSSVAGLSANTTYYVRAYATNSAGIGYGNEISFTTTTSANIPTLTTIAATNIAFSSATCGGNVTNEGNSSVTARGICWSISPSPTIANNKTIDGSGIGGFTSSMTGLSANTTYHVRAYATNSSGTGYGNQILFTTRIFFDLGMTIYNTSNSSLPINNIYALAIDNNGNKWLGNVANTNVGLVKFDGVNSTVYSRYNSPLPDNNILTIGIDGNGTKWIGLSQQYGVSKFDGVNWKQYNYTNSLLSGNDVLSIAFESNGIVWFGTGTGGLIKFDGTNWTSDKSWGDMISSILVDANGNKWIGSGTGLIKYNAANSTKYTTSNSGLPDNNIIALALDKNGDLWIGTGNGLTKFDGANWTVYNTSNTTLISNYIVTIAIDNAGNKWIGAGTGGGLTKFDGINWTTYTTSNSKLPDNTILSIAIAPDGSKWFGTRNGGLIKIP